MPIDLLHSFLQQATSSGSRSTVLTDLRWFSGIFISGLLIAFKFNAPNWLLVFLAVLIGCVSLLYLAAYIFFAICAPDLLRSEKFTLSKLAIEHSVKGDNLAGFIDAENSNPLVQSITPKEQKDE